MIEPYYSNNGITIYHSDCIDVLRAMPKGSFQSIVTDPPFSSGARTDAGKSMRGGMLRGKQWKKDWFSHDNMATHGFLYLIRLLGVESLSKASKNATGHFFTEWSFLT